MFKCKRIFAVCALLAATLASFGAAGCAVSPAGTGSTGSAVEQKAALSVQVTVDATAAEGDVLSEGAVSLPEGATAYDALMATKLSVNAEESSYGMYVTAVGGYAAEGSAGWMYYVNGEEASVACDEYELADGDEVSWTYVVF